MNKIIGYYCEDGAFYCIKHAYGNADACYKDDDGNHYCSICGKNCDDTSNN